VTDANAFYLAGDFLVAIGLATGITLRVTRRRPHAPMLALLIAGGMCGDVACTLLRDWLEVFWGLGLMALGLGLLAWDARKGTR
jgi:hypothetical protein